ncbi:MAG: histidine triad (HIT) protein [Candidatus Riflebacteria bacterium HGW-Riflebacteria-1]|jgi:ATP adenylyltransferase|nr:MAG: histidine triad (HIT) protein [Candidatus Riflebacteria bacterium HGW-Riflebacteria-1]
MTFRKQLFIPNKRAYITGLQRPSVDCIICSIINDDPAVSNLTVWKNTKVAACANLYPYNAGHILLYPLRHIEDPRELTAEESAQMHTLLCQSLARLDSVYHPEGYNIGYNIGEASGASIEHLHQHIVPRYPRELGFVDITAGAKIIIEDPNVTLTRLREAFADLNF